MNNRRFRSFDRRPSTAFATCPQDRAASRRNDCAHPPSPILLSDRVIFFCTGGRNGHERAKERSKSKGTKHGANGHPLAGTLYRPGIDPWGRFIEHAFSSRFAQARVCRATGSLAAQSTEERGRGKAETGRHPRRTPIGSTDLPLRPSRTRASPILAGRPRPARRRAGKHRPKRLIFIVPAV